MQLLRSLVVVIVSACFLFICSHAISAQELPRIDEFVLAQHIDHRVDPVYPAIAKAALVHGTVVVEIQVGADGKVQQVKAVSGPPMLQQSAIDCVKQWSYKPFLVNGSPAKVRGKIQIDFDLGNDTPTDAEEKISQRYFVQADECRKSNASKNTEEAATVCKKAAEIAEEFPADRRFIEKRSAFVQASWALMQNNNLNDAMHYTTRAVEIVELGHDDNSGSNGAYYMKGFVEGRLGLYADSDRDLEMAEDFERKAIDWAKSEKFVHLDSYYQAYDVTLRLHAKVLEVMGRADDSKKRMDEASQYEKYLKQ